MSSQLILNSSSMSAQSISIRMINVPRISNIILSKLAQLYLYSRCLSLILYLLTDFFVCLIDF